MQLLDVLLGIPFYQSNQSIAKDIEISNIQIDHRLVEDNDMFICIRGFTVDGHDFAIHAVEKGAKVIVAEENINMPPGIIVIVVSNTTKALALIAAAFYEYPSHTLPLIGITGTNGKTTITYLLEKIFQTNQLQTGVIGTIQTKIGRNVFPITNTTPNALVLQSLFRKMVNADVDITIMEVSSHALDMGRVFGSDFNIAVFTNLTQDHLDYHKDMEDYLRAKTLLFTGLGNGYQYTNKYAVLNIDDIHSDFIAKSTSQPIITYGMKKAADISADQIAYGLKGMEFRLVTPVGKIQIRTPLIGKFNIYNILAAASVALLRKIPLENIRYALECISGVDGRFQQVDAGQDFAVIVDYAHTPDSLENVLTTIQEFAKNNIYVVVGSGGDRDKTKRPLMAKTAVDYGDWVIFTSDNPRTEDPEDILSDMTKGLTATNMEVTINRQEAIEKAVSYAQTGDAILIAGKGHETYQEINGVRHNFDDRVVAKVAIEQKE